MWYSFSRSFGIHPAGTLNCFFVMLRDYILELDLIISILNTSFVRLDVSFILPKLKSNWVNIPGVPETKYK